MTQPQKKSFPLVPLLGALALDAATFGCFYAFYALPDGKTLWLIAGIACAIASFPLYTRVAVGFGRRGGGNRG